jgi:copper(I)-binding protein
MTFRWLALTSLVALATAAPAPTTADGAKITVEGAWARRAPMMSGDPQAGSGNSAVYATLVNPGDRADALVAAATEVAGTVEIHETYQDMGMTMMRPINRIEIPPRQRVEMKPGGYHLMLVNVKRDLQAGQSFGLTLRFDRAGAIPVTALVR